MVVNSVSPLLPFWRRLGHRRGACARRRRRRRRRKRRRRRRKRHTHEPMCRRSSRLRE
jgi:hypothetical protein